jgi:hypothetical protein
MALIATVLISGTAALAQTAKMPLVSFDDLMTALKEGVEEEEILKGLIASPTHFTLSEYQSAQLERIGASKRILDALKTKPIQAGSAGSDITDLAIILDCSGSMKERTPDGDSKMEAAKRVLTGLIPSIPNGLDVTCVLYGFDARKTCDAVQVVRPISPLDDAGKKELLDLVAGLRPVGSTPIALALRTAGLELAKSEGLSEIVLVTDGMETCNGKPVDETLALMARLNLKSVEVIGMGVSKAERAGLEEIAKAGKGHYYSARNANEIAAAFEKTIPVGRLKVEAPTRSMRTASVSGVIITPLTLKGFPAIAYVVACKPGKGVSFGKVQSTDRTGQVMIVPPGNYDLFYQTVDSGNDPVLIVKDLKVPPKQTVTIESNRVVSAIVVNDLGLGAKLSSISVYCAGNRNPFQVMRAKGLGSPLVVAPDQEYDVCVRPEGNAEVVIAEKVRPKAGEMLVIGGEGDGKQEQGQGAAEAPGSGPSEGAADNTELAPVETDNVKSSPAKLSMGSTMTPKVSALVAQLSSRDWQVRRRAAEELGDLGDESKPAVPALIRRVADMQGAVAGFQLIRLDGSRVSALLALRRLAPERVEEALRLATQTRDFAVQMWALKLLKDMKPGGSKPVTANAPKLKPALRFKQFGGAKTVSGRKGRGGIQTAPSGGFRGLGDVQQLGEVQQSGEVKQSGEVQQSGEVRQSGEVQQSRKVQRSSAVQQGGGFRQIQ